MSNDQSVFGNIKRVTANICGLNGNLSNDGGLRRLRHIDHTETQRCAFVRQKENATAVRILLEHEALATVAVLVEVVVTDDLQIFRLDGSRNLGEQTDGKNNSSDYSKEQTTSRHSGADYILQHNGLIKK